MIEGERVSFERFYYQSPQSADELQEIVHEWRKIQGTRDHEADEYFFSIMFRLQTLFDIHGIASLTVLAGSNHIYMLFMK